MMTSPRLRDCDTMLCTEGEAAEDRVATAAHCRGDTVEVYVSSAVWNKLLTIASACLCDAACGCSSR